MRRVARFLMQHCQTDGNAEPLRTPHRVLAGMLGMRPETLSRALSELRSSGALARGRALKVSSHERLRELSE